MNAWPADSRAEGSNAKGKKKQDNFIGDYPHLTPGLLSSATLIEQPNGRLEWSSVTGAMNKRKRRRVTARAPVTFFPATRTPELPLPHTTIQQRAEEGANFLRTYLPDVDVTAELIREEITHDGELARETQTFDPLAGNVIAPVVCFDSSAKAFAHLAFPAGELGNELNISPYTVSGDVRAVFSPRARSTRTFNTPVQQIVAHSPTAGVGNPISLLAVRTFGATHAFQVQASHSTPPPPPSPDLLTLKRAHTGGKYVVDMAFHPTPLTLVVVNEVGAVFSADMNAGQSSITKLVDPLDTSAQNDSFWRLKVDPSTTTALLASSSAVRRIDSRENTTPTTIFSLTRPPERLTAIEDDPSEHLVRLCTTTQLLWLDPRFLARPLLAYAHGRQYDPALQIHTARMCDTPLTFLSSPNNGLITVYDVSRADGELVYAHRPPYALPSSAVRFVGQALFRHPSITGDDSTLSCVRISGRGQLSCVALCFGDDDGIDSQGAAQAASVQWDDEVKELAVTAENFEPDAGPLGAQDKVEMNLRMAYDRVFRQYDEERRAAEEANTESVYDVLDNAPRYWQQAEEYPDHMLTSYDILFRTGDEPKNPSRADFLTQSAINSHRGYRALVQDRIPLNDVQKGAKWHCDLQPSLAKLDVDFSAGSDIHERLRRFDLAPDDTPADEGPEAPSAVHPRTAASIRLENEARQQLALDLSLSRHIFSARPFTSPPDMTDDLETMTEALSLANDPPPVHFSYLQPIARDHYTRDQPVVEEAGSAEPVEQALNLPPGVRLLLSEWDLGADPAEYAYHDPYDADAMNVSPPIARRKKAPTAILDSAISQSQSQFRVPPSIQPSNIIMASLLGPDLRGPPVIASSQPPLVAASQPAFVMNEPRRALASQPTEFNHTQLGYSQPRSTFTATQSSQDLMPSTQVLPGPFGGRPAPKKKPTKKRVGGF